jgi:AcrR family transcriptional regulator
MATLGAVSDHLPEALRALHADAATARPGGRTARIGEAVMAATLDELSEVGYAALRIEAVAARAGVNKTTIYRRWGNKAGLVATALIERQAEAVPAPDTGDLRQDVLTLLTLVRDALKTPWFSILMREVGPRTGQGGGVGDVLDKLWPERLRSSRVIFERAIARGDLSPDADPDFLIEAMSGPLYFRLLIDRPLDDDFLEKATDLFLDGARASST